MCVIFVGTLHVCNICGDTTCVIFVGTVCVCNICGDSV
jgi:hypothetical protein